MLYGRAGELAAIDDALDRARSGRSGTLVVRGEAGIGKSALLSYAEQAGPGRRLVSGTGVESEEELPFAGLNLLLGMEQRPRGDRFAIGLEVLNRLTELAADGPLLCLVDDAHWLDRGSADALLFAARRLDTEGILLIFAARDDEEFAAPGIESLRLGRLDVDSARSLLGAHDAELPSHVRDRIVDEARGNPLALLELADAYRDGWLAPFPHPGATLPTHGRIQQTFASRVEVLPERTRAMLLVLAADASGDPAVVLPAGERLGLSIADLEPAESARLIRIVKGKLDFRHPLIRAAVYQGAPLGLRLDVHRALASVFEAQQNVCQRAWHLAAGTTGPDESVAAALDHSAEIDRTLGGYAAVASAYERAAELSADPGRRGARLLAAAEAAVDAGQASRADTLAGSALVYVTDPADTRRVALVHATLADEGNRPLDAFRALLDAASADRGQASGLLAWAACCAVAAGDLSLVDSTVSQVDGLPDAGRVRLLARVAHGDAAAVPALLESGAPDGHRPALRWEIVTTSWRLRLGDHEAAYHAAVALERDCRECRAFGLLPQVLALLADAQLRSGRHQDARGTGTEGMRIAEDLDQPASIGAIAGVLAHFAAIEGDEERCTELAGRATSLGDPQAVARSDLALGLLELGAGRHEAAAAHLARVPDAVPDLVEAAVRLNDADSVTSELARYTEWARATEAPGVRALAARGAALLAGDDTAEPLFRRAVSLPAPPFDRARTELLYGEWLRRARRPTDARPHLRAAADAFDRLGAAPWSTRAHTELRASGDSGTHPATPADLAGLTPRELAVVRLASDGLTNREIAAQLYLSPRTVGYHLYKAFPKLGISSRSELILNATH